MALLMADLLCIALSVTLVSQVTNAAPLSLCLPCPPGQGVIKKWCTLSKPTSCAPCQSTFDSEQWSSTSPCLPCSRCGPDLYELHSCNLTHDVFCELCSWPGSDPKNPDFKIKCNPSQRQSSNLSDNDNKKMVQIWVEPLLVMNDDPVVHFEDAEEQTAMDDREVIGEKSLLQKGDVEYINDSSSQLKEYPEVTQDEVTIESKMATVAVKSVQDQIDDVLKNEEYPSATPANNTINPDEDDDNRIEDSGTIKDKGLVFTQEDADLQERINLNKMTSQIIIMETSTSPVQYKETITRKENNVDLGKREEDKEKDNITNKEGESVSEEKIKKGKPEIDTFAGPSNQGEKPEDQKVGASSEGGVGTFSILMAIITAGLICFALGFFLHRYKTSSGPKHKRLERAPLHMEPVYSTVPTDSEADDKNNKPVTPEIIYTSHDEPDLKTAAQDILQAPSSAKKRQQEIRKSLPVTGKYQSPIDIDPEDAKLSDELESSRLVFKYVPENTKSLTNIGTTVKVMVDCRGSDLHGGPLGEDKRYCLDHFRFRWGADDTQGSEHSVAGKRYAGEIQLVHWNKEDFRSYTEATRYESGLAIISVFMDVTGEEHTSLQVLLDVFKSTKYKGESVEVPHHYFDPASLLPSLDDYWTYPGSMTESPYSETATWLIMKEPINVSSGQMARFRGLMRCERDELHGKAEEEMILNNLREQSELGDRSIRASFH